jgi:hypothetical protein
MKTVTMIAVCLLLGVTFIALGAAAQQPKAGSAGSTQLSAASVDQLHFISVLTLRGEVVAVDPANLLVTVKSAEGRYSNLETRREQNLQGLKVGGRITVRYFEGAQIREQRLGEAAPDFSLKEGIMNATLGGPSRRKHALVASVEKVDTVNQQITIKAPDGSLETIMVTNPEYLDHVKVGDRVGMTRVQALALSLKKEN